MDAAEEGKYVETNRCSDGIFFGGASGELQLGPAGPWSMQDDIVPTLNRTFLETVNGGRTHRAAPNPFE